MGQAGKWAGVREKSRVFTGKNFFRGARSMALAVKSCGTRNPRVAEKGDQANHQGAAGKMAYKQGKDDRGGEKAHPKPETGPIQGIDQKFQR